MTRRRPVRLLPRLAALVVVLATAVAVRSSAPADADSAADTPYGVPAAVDANPAPDVFETTLVAQAVTRDIGQGVGAKMWSFNGSVPGPEIRVRVGDTVIVHYRNELPLPSSIHWHGIELNNASDGTALTQNAVATGGTFLYKFEVPRPGIFWYHPHHRPTNQVFRGLYGSLIVTDEADETLVAKGVLPPRERTKTLVLSDVTVCKEPGRNDKRTYPASMPWVGGGSLPAQPSPNPNHLCDQPLDDHGNPVVDHNGAPVPLRAGDIPNIQKTGEPPNRTNEGQTVLANGSNPGPRAGSPEAPGALAAGATTLDVAAGQGVRLQAVNAATTRYMRLLLTDGAGNRIPIVRIGGEGGLLDAARLEGNGPEDLRRITVFNTKFDRGEVVLSPSDRTDLVVSLPRETPVGVATLWTLDYERTGIGFALVPTVPVMHLNVTAATAEAYTLAEGAPLRTHPAVDDPVERLGPPPGLLPDLSGAISPLLEPATFSPPKPGSPDEDIELTSGGNPAIDNVAGNHESAGGDYRRVPHTTTTRYARLGDLLELTVTNTSAAHHAFHLHGFSFQPLAFERMLTAIPGPNYTFDYREFVDTVDIPPEYSLRFRVRLDDRPQMDGVTPGGGLGRWVFHCHIFFHAGLGMHSELVVLAPDGNEKPFVDADSTVVAVTQGGTATTGGTYLDPDGDAVALDASVGTVTDIGDGRWSWSLASDQVPAGRRTVHVTATDTRNHRAQAAFDLDIENVTPTVTVTSPPSGSSYPVGSTVTVTAAVADPGSSPPACRFDWDDGTGAGPPVAVVDGTCSDTRTLSRPGVFTVDVSASDAEGATGAARTAVVVFDPDGGFVTGSGTSGRAGFDVAVKYLKGVPVGEVLYDDPAGFRFQATSVHWLVIAGSNGQARGSGSVGTAPGYDFLLTVVDGNGSAGPDRLRLKVWDAATGTVAYDNAPGQPDDIDTAAPPAIGSGNLVVHRQ